MTLHYEWTLAEGYPQKNENPKLNVFGTFICGGGSTMGYKLAGFNHLGGVEIDPRMAKVYKANHNPKHLYVEDIRTLTEKPNSELPQELFNLDILDGAPPCSSFSAAGNREKDWGKKKKFKEGQAHQTLDDLFFEFIKLTDKLKPKVVIAENVKGMIQGNARAYVKKVVEGFKSIGYNVQLFLLNAASMGVPQKRERVFFICHRKELNFPKLTLEFNERPIPYREVESKGPRVIESMGKGETYKYWKLSKPGASLKEAHPTGSYFNIRKLDPNGVCNTVTSHTSALIHYRDYSFLDTEELLKIGSFPTDYNFLEEVPNYIIGMSVPPLMMARVATEVYKQWFQQREDKDD